MITYILQKITVNGVDYPGIPSGDTTQISLTVTEDTTVTFVYQEYPPTPTPTSLAPILIGGAIAIAIALSSKGKKGK